MACITTSFVRLLIATDASVLDTLLEIGKRNFDIDGMIENEIPVLHFAVIFRHVDAVKVLLKHGASVNLEDKDGNTCLHLALQTDVSIENVERIRHILKDVVLDSACKEKLTAPFSSDTENRRRLQQFFERNSSENKYEPGVQYADFVIDNTSLIELLLSSGANPNHQNRNLSWSTPLLTYCCHKYNSEHIRIINLLLDYGLDVNIKGNDGSTALGIVAEYGTVEEVEKLLDAGADVNELSSGDLPLCVASCSEHGNEAIVSIIKLLVARGANVNALNSYGWTPLDTAVNYGPVEGVECLLRLGANPNLYEDIPPLYTSVSEDKVKITECLINYGADVFYQNSDRCSLLNIAVKESDDLEENSYFYNVVLKLVTLLMERGVTIDEHDYTDLTTKNIEWLEKCQHQLQTLKETKICPNSPTTYFDFLLKRDLKLVRCLRDENIAAAMKSEEYKKEFVYFAHRLETNYDRGLKQVDMIDELRSILSDVFKDIFPEELIFVISDYFNLEDLGKCFGDEFNA